MVYLNEHPANFQNSDKRQMTTNPSQNKKSCKAKPKPTRFAAHRILPNAPKTIHHPGIQIFVVTNTDLRF